MARFGGSEDNQQILLDHPVGLFILFFTEMWERFSYYGMRALLVLFLTSAIIDGGWAWPTESALALYGTYTSLVYITPILGGYLADRYLGYRNAVALGALVMTLGHASMALETPFFLYVGLACLVIGNGFFKPNITSIISNIYKNHPEKKDGAYTIFYMGVNAGAFLGIMLCGYIGEKVGWSYGFGLAGIFMFFGMLQFWLAQRIFGRIGLPPSQQADYVEERPATTVGPVTGSNILDEEPREEPYEEDTADRQPFPLYQQLLIGIMAAAALVWIFNDPYSKISGNNLLNFSVGGLSGENFTIIAALALFLFLLIFRLVNYRPVVRDRMIAIIIFAVFTVLFWASFEQAGGSMTLFARDFTNRTLEGTAGVTFKIFNSLLTVVPLAIITWVLYSLFQRTFKHYALSNIVLGSSFAVIWGIVIWMLLREWQSEAAEIQASWFGILNSFFIISFAPLFSKWWESKYNPSAAIKYGLGLILLGIGFAALSFGSLSIPSGAETAAVSMIWLILAYLFHTLGELCLSPVGLSYVSKLVPGSMIAFMFGIWYLAIAIGNKIAGTTGGMIEQITEKYDLTTFFLLFTLIPIGMGLVSMLLNPIVKRLMHGIR